jgi:hypothetical protein
MNIYHESRGESLKGQIAVAAITLNRVVDKDYPTTICRVVYEKKAFSWTKSHVKISEEESFNRAKKIAHQYLLGKHANPIGNRKFFNHVRLGKRFDTPYKPIRISNMIYY